MMAPPDFDATRIAGSHGAPWFGTYDLAFVTPQLSRAAAVWEAKRGARTMPARADLGIRDLKFCLPNITLMDIVRGGEQLRFRVRLMGSVMDEQVAPVTGRFIDEVVPPHFAQKWAAQWMPTIEECKLRRAAGRVEFAGRRWFVAESLYAPLSDDGKTPNILMVVAYYHALDQADNGSRELAAEIDSFCSADATR